MQYTGFELQVVGGCWYVLAFQRVTLCLRQQCQKNNNCDLISLACYKTACNNSTQPSAIDGLSCNNSTTSTGFQNVAACLSDDGSFLYGIYDTARQVVSSNSITVKILYPIFWGIMILRYIKLILKEKKNQRKRESVDIIYTQ